MGKNKTGSSSNKIANVSGGNRKKVRIKKEIRRLKMKIARWELYKESGKIAWTAIKEKKHRSVPNKSRYRNWDTTGLKKHKELLEALI